MPASNVVLDRLTQIRQDLQTVNANQTHSSGYDNALAETAIDLFKSFTGARPRRSFEAAPFATLEWVDGFNNRRLLEPIGDIPPAEAEANFYTALEQPPRAA